LGIKEKRVLFLEDVGKSFIEIDNSNTEEINSLLTEIYEIFSLKSIRFAQFNFTKNNDFFFTSFNFLNLLLQLLNLKKNPNLLQQLNMLKNLKNKFILYKFFFKLSLVGGNKGLNFIPVRSMSVSKKFEIMLKRNIYNYFFDYLSKKKKFFFFGKKFIFFKKKLASRIKPALKGEQISIKNLKERNFLARKQLIEFMIKGFDRKYYE
jgi:hypothetical protein